MKRNAAPMVVLAALTVLVVAAVSQPVTAATQQGNAQAQALMKQVTLQLASSGENVRVAMMEWITLADSGELGRTVLFSDRGNKQLGSDWVPVDPRRGGRINISYIVDLVDGATSNALSPLTAAQTTAAIDRAMATWNQVDCSTIPITNSGAVNADLGIVQRILGFGGSFSFFVADITDGGWLPRGFFDALIASGGDFILGVTFTFSFVDGSGNFTDINNDGKRDTALREIYYNDNFPWGISTNFPIDVESVALHESGHGLSQAHFGEAFRTVRNGKLHFAPRVVMNAAFSGIQQDPAGTDLGGHCSIWANWPNR